MPTITKRTLDAARAKPAGDRLLWDDRLTGFGVRIKPSGATAFLIQYRNANGRSRRLTLGSYPALTPDQARDDAMQALAAAKRGGDPAETKRRDREAVTVRELCTEYIGKAERGVIITRRGKAKSGSTLATDRGRIERHIVPLLGHRAVTDVSRADVVAFLRDVSAGKTAANVKTRKFGRAIVKGGAGTGTRTLGLLGGIFSFALEEGIRDDNPVTGVRRPKGEARSVRLDDKGYAALGKALGKAEGEGEPWQAVAIIRLLALTGCRRGEIANLQRSEVDLAGMAFRFGSTKTGKSIRPIGKTARDVLSKAIERSSGKFVFPSDRKPSKAFVGLPRAYKRIVGFSIGAVTPHGLRHAFASIAEDQGLTVPTIGALLGHAGAGVTAGYIHKLDPALISAADAVSLRISAAMKGKAKDSNVVTLRTA